MMKSKKHTNVLVMSLVVAFLFGCSVENKHKSSVDASSEKTIKEAATEKGEQTEKTGAQEAVSSENPEAAQKLTFAQNNLKMAQKGILSYSQTVAICRGIIRDYPDTEYQQKAQMLLRQVPEDLHSQYNLSDEELGL